MYVQVLRFGSEDVGQASRGRASWSVVTHPTQSRMIHVCYFLLPPPCLLRSSVDDMLLRPVPHRDSREPHNSTSNQKATVHSDSEPLRV